MLVGLIFEKIKNIFTDGYSFFQFMTLVSVVALNLYQAHKYKMTVGRCLAVTLLVYAMAYPLMFVLCWVESGFQNWGGQNFIRVFIWIPLLAWPASKIVHTGWKTTCDIAAPCMTLAMGVGKFGCACAGCCRGYPCDWGIYCKEIGMKCFPVQICEAVTALLITWYLLLYAKRRGYSTDGRTYALMLILFGSTRFIWEFFRYNQKIVLGLSALSIHAFVMCAAGFVFYYIIIPELENKRAGKRRIKHHS